MAKVFGGDAPGKATDDQFAAAFGMDAFDPNEPRDQGGEWTTGVGTVSPEEHRALHAYTGSGNEHIVHFNRVLRGQTAASQSDKALFKTLDGIIGRSKLTKNAALYRGALANKRMNADALKAAVGKTVKFGGYMSASTDMESGRCSYRSR